MSLVPIYKRCHVCGRTYSWNPDVGRMNCPYCSKKWKKVLRKILKRKPKTI